MSTRAQRFVLTLLMGLMALSAAAEGPKVIPLQKTKDIKAVYQVSDLMDHEGFHKGLAYARKLMKSYGRNGVPAKEVDLHLVYHSGAIPALLKDEPYQRLTGKTELNPNKELVAELVQEGVHLEICGDTMRQKDVKNSDLLEGIDIVPGAYPRLIELQSAGYSYIKFE